MFVHIVRNMLFYDLEKPGTFGVSNQILQDTKTELCKTHKTGIIVGKQR